MPKILLKSQDSLRTKLKKTSLLKELPANIEPLYFVDSGSWMLNLALTNNIDMGYPIGRVINLVGDFSSGKSLLLCELINSLWFIEHKINNKKIKIYYDEPEFAFDLKLARQFNMPLEHIYGLRERLPNHKKQNDDFQQSKTIEDLYRNLSQISNEQNKYDIILYAIDSLDSISDAREIKHIEKKGIDKQDYGGGKARVLSQMFRTCIQSVNESNIIFFTISQVRENFGGGPFSPKYVRAGGKALDHYASVIFWLKEVGKIESKNKINQGIDVELHITKNKVGSRYNKLTFSILHGYGVDNYSSAVNFLWDQNAIEKSGNYIVWNNKKLYRSELIELTANDPSEAKKLKIMLQDYWNQIIEEASIKRKPKWR